MAVKNAIGIDLGTTNSCVAIMEGDIAQVIENKEGRRTTPSVVNYQKNGEILVGEAAKRKQVVEPESTLSSVKRLIGARYKDPVVQKDISAVPYKMVAADNGDVRIKVGDKLLAPPQVSAEVLRYCMDIAATRLSMSLEQLLESVKQDRTAVVITVPAYFNDSQRQATKDAAFIAGFEPKRIINEPTAAGMAYGLNKDISAKEDETRKVAVYDLGGGTFDISIMEIVTLEGERQFEILSTNGDTFLGGEDFDRKLIEYLISEFKQSQGIDLQRDPLALQRLKEAAEKAKIELSSAKETDVNLPYITADQSGPKHLAIKLTRAKLESLVEKLVMRTLEPCKIALKDAKLSIDDIDEVILVGGQTRMPKVQEAVEQFFGKKPRRDVNPDEAVAAGAAIQAGVLAGSVKDVLLLDVTPLSLGIETLGGVMTKLIEKNTTIPTKVAQTFSTAENNQPAVTIHILQGERERASANRSLGRFDLTDIPPAPRGVPQIEVTFDIDANGLLKVSAKNKATGKAQAIEVRDSSGLASEEIEQMRKDAELNRDADLKFKELVELKNTADHLISTTGKALEEAGDKISAEEKEQLESAMNALKEARKGENKDEIDKCFKALTETASKMADRLYSAPKASESSDSVDSATAEDSSDVVDAQFEEVKDQDKE